jgi:hypothetical protein
MQSSKHLDLNDIKNEFNPILRLVLENDKKQFYIQLTCYHNKCVSSKIENLINQGEIDPYDNKYIRNLVENPYTFHLVKDYVTQPENINDYYSSIIRNPLAMELNLIDINNTHFQWDSFSLNSHPNAIKILENNMDKISITNILSNKGASCIIKKLIDNREIDDIWEKFSESKNPLFIKFLMEYKDKDPSILNKLNWYFVSMIPEAIDIILDNFHLVDIRGFYRNPAKEAVDYYFKQITSSPLLSPSSFAFYASLNTNDRVIKYFQENILQTNIYLKYLPFYLNTALLEEFCKMDYNKMRDIFDPVFEEICKTVFHPNRLENLYELYWKKEGLEFIDVSEIY